MADGVPGVPAGWYPHPDKPDVQIWWTGAGWSDQTRPAPEGATVLRTPDADAAAPQGRPGGFGVVVIGGVALVVVVFVVGLIGAVTSGKSSSPPTSTGNSYTQLPNAAQPPPVVTYEVTGAANGASVTYSTPTGTQQHDVTLPMQNTKGGVVSFKADHGAFLYLSAQNQGDQGYVTCKIAVDGVTLSENTSSGAYAIATCKGSMP